MGRWSDFSKHGDTVPRVRTPAGDAEREALSRTWNFVEAMGVMVYALVVLWGIAYALGVMGGVAQARRLSEVLIAAGSAYVLFIAPRIHRDTLESWGLGNPRTLWRLLRTGSPVRRAAGWAVVLALFLLLNVLIYRNWGRLMSFLGLRRTVMRGWDQGFPGLVGVFAFSGIASLLVVTVVVRYDNFLTAFRTALFVILPLLALTVGAALVQQGRAMFDGLDPAVVGSHVFGYLFWGCLQQLLFSSYFGTRVRKAFAPSFGPPGDPWKRLPFIAGFGVFGALATGAFCVFLLWNKHGRDSLPVLAIPVFSAFFLLPFLGYAWFYVKDRRRLLVATLNGTFFGLIHHASFGLAAITFFLGIILGYVFMEDRNRNLVALGFIHGVLGSALGLFFRGRAAGILAVNRQVGPWHVRGPTWAVVVFPALWVLIYAGLAFWRSRRQRA